MVARGSCAAAVPETLRQLDFTLNLLKIYFHCNRQHHFPTVGHDAHTTWQKRGLAPP